MADYIVHMGRRARVMEGVTAHMMKPLGTFEGDATPSTFTNSLGWHCGERPNVPLVGVVIPFERKLEAAE